MKTLQESFDEKWIPVTESGCWLWMDFIYKGGYGVFKPVKGTRMAHRVAWMLYKGEIPGNKCVCHKCDIPSCVNPSHLFLGSHKDNSLDMKRKNRQAKGEKNGGSKLNIKKVMEIRKSYEGGGVSYRSLAKRYEIGLSQIARIIKNNSWKWL